MSSLAWSSPSRLLPYGGRCLVSFVLVGGVAVAGAPAARAATPQVLTAPGRVAVAVDRSRLKTVDQQGARDAVPVGKDGSVVALIPTADGRGATLLALTPVGRARSSFGHAGVVRIAVPRGAGRFDASQLLRDRRGRLLVIGKLEVGLDEHVAVMRFSARGARDMSYGTNGLAQQSGFLGSEAPADVAADGSVVLAQSPGMSGVGEAPGHERWDVVRLDPSGHLDAGFGVAGRTTLAEAGAFGCAARLLADGRVATVAMTNDVANGGYASRLLPDGRLDLSYNGGQPAPIPFPQSIAVRPGGQLDVLQDFKRSGVIMRLTATGARDRLFGSQGTTSIKSSDGAAHLLARSDGSDLVWLSDGHNGLAVQDVAADGRTVRPRNARIPFATGEPSAVTFGARASLGAIEARALVARPGGRLLVLGAAPVERYTGEGEGYSTVPVAAALLRPDYTLDPSFGGPRQPARVSVALDRQLARTALRSGRLRVHYKASGPGTILLRVRNAHGRVLAEEFDVTGGTATTAASVRLTSEGQRLLANQRGIHVSFAARFRDVVGALAHGQTEGNIG